MTDAKTTYLTKRLVPAYRKVEQAAEAPYLRSLVVARLLAQGKDQAASLALDHLAEDLAAWEAELLKLYGEVDALIA